MRWVLVLTALALAGQVSARNCVILLHGLGRTSHSMGRLEDALIKGGYLVVNESYPSRKKSVQELAQVVGEGIRRCKEHNPATINLVTHSLGGILVRVYFQREREPLVRRVVMLAPPNHGSEIADVYARKWWYRFSTGPAGQELGTGAQGISQTLGEIPLEVGIIAGTRSIDPWFASVMPSPNDGKVSVESAKLSEMRDFITVPYTHTFMSRRRAVARQVLLFLSEGRFEHSVGE